VSRVDLRRLVPALATLGLTVAMLVLGAAGRPLAALFFVLAGAVAVAIEERGAVVAQLVLVAAGLAIGSAQGRRLDVAVDLIAIGLLGWFVSRARARWRARHDELRRLARRDPLTGVANYRFLSERLSYEIARHRRYRRRFALLVVDLDAFKQINDRHGHLEGDLVLQAVASAMSEAARDGDTVARQGGDEFCVLAPETGHQGAAVLGRRIGEAISWAAGPERRLTGRVGWAVYPDDGASARELMRHADAAMRERKDRLYSGVQTRRAA
jgi:diguanylate cyclase (GGDEF)-like protein